MSQRDSRSWRRRAFAGAALSIATIATMLLATSGVNLLNAQGDYDGERRRADLGPITLPGGSVVEFGSFESHSLGGPERYSVFLPPSFSKERSRTYPVIYFLHGLNNDETSWTVERYGSMQNTIERMMLSGKIPEFVMAHPRGDNSFYCNYLDGAKRYEDLIATEFVEFMESRYRAAKSSRQRAIAGTSMGGYGALKLAMKHPDRYGAVVGHSPILFPGRNPLELSESASSSRFSAFFVNMLKPIFGDPIRQDVWDANNPLSLAKDRNLAGLKIYFDYGTADRYIPIVRLDEGSAALDRILTERSIPHTFKIHPGAPHGWALIAAHLEESLRFACQTFK